MDVAALFPSITTELACKYIGEALAVSKLDFSSFNIEYLCKYVALCATEETIKCAKLWGKIAKPKSKTTLNSYLRHRQQSQFLENPDWRNLTTSDVRNVVSISL